MLIQVFKDWKERQQKRHLEVIATFDVQTPNRYYCGMCGWVNISNPCVHHPGK